MLCCKIFNKPESSLCPQYAIRRLFHTGFVVSLGIAITVVLSTLVISTICANTDDKAIEFEEVVVEYNDTLWTIACRYRPGEDPRKVVWHIKKLNQCGAQIRPGQTVKIPIL
jgi:hypothetical protein